MKFRTTLIPIVLAAAPLTSYWNESTASAAARVGVSVAVSAQAEALPTSMRSTLSDDERGQLQQATDEASSLGAMRGGEWSNHELGIGLVILAVLVVLILI